MKQTIKLTESELRQMIEMSINEAMQDEGFFGNIGRGFKSAFGGDAQRIGQAAGRMGKSVANGVQKAGQAVGQAAANVGKGIQNKANDIKVGYQSGKQNDQLTSLQKNIQGMLDSGAIHGNQAVQAANAFLKVIPSLIGQNNTAASAPRGIQASRFSEEE